MNSLGRMMLALRSSAAKNQYPIREKKMFAAASGTIHADSPSVNLITKLGIAKMLQRIKEAGMLTMKNSLRFYLITIE